MPHAPPSHGTPMRSPSWKRAAPGPTAATLPTISCPGTSGSFGCGSSPSTTCRSVRQTAQAVTSRSTWPGPGRGRAISATRSGRPGASRTMARIAADSFRVTALSCRSLEGLLVHVLRLADDVAPALVERPGLDALDIGAHAHRPVAVSDRPGLGGGNERPARSLASRGSVDHQSGQLGVRVRHQEDPPDDVRPADDPFSVVLRDQNRLPWIAP